MNIKGRLIEFIAYKGLSVSKFETSVGLSNGYIRNFKGAMGEDKMNNILNTYPDLSKIWLLTGEGSMLRSDESVSNAVSENTKDTGLKYYYEMDATASVTEVFDDEQGANFRYLNFPEYTGCVGFNVSGDSMLPTAKSGDIVVIHPQIVETIINGEVYLVITKDNQRMIKRVVRVEEGIICHSDNENKELYASQLIPKEQILHLFRVKGFISHRLCG